MAKKFQIILLCLIFLLVSVFSVSAQDVNVDDLSNEQLMELLQAIMQKLEDGNSEKPLQTDPEGDETTVGSTIENASETVAEAPRFQIYENKKLILERIPDDRFIQKQDKSPEKEPGSKKKDDTGTDFDLETCPPGLFWDCTPERCLCISPNG